jgi:hypothetical protein
MQTPHEGMLYGVSGFKSEEESVNAVQFGE